MAKTRTKYIGIGILTVLGFLGWFANSNNFDLEISGDIYCQEECRSYFNITSKYYTYYLYNKEGVKLDFLPEIKDYAICKPDKRCKSCGGCPEGWREIDFASPYTKRYKYVYKFYKGKKETFMIIGHKEPFETIKWGINAVNEYRDPIWIGSENVSVNITPIKDCHTEYYTDIEDVFGEVTNKKRIYFDEEVFLNESFCIDEPTNLTCDERTFDNYTRTSWRDEYYNVTVKIGKKPVQKPYEVCDIIGYDIDGKKLNCKKEGWKCYLKEDEIIEKTPHQSAKKVSECIEGSGEYCCRRNVVTLKSVCQGEPYPNNIGRLKIE